MLALPEGMSDTLFAYEQSPMLAPDAMAPLVLSLAQSESKARFFDRLGLDPTDRVHKRVYALMKVCAPSLGLCGTRVCPDHGPR